MTVKFEPIKPFDERKLIEIKQGIAKGIDPLAKIIAEARGQEKEVLQGKANLEKIKELISEEAYGKAEQDLNLKQREIDDFREKVREIVEGVRNVLDKFLKIYANEESAEEISDFPEIISDDEETKEGDEEEEETEIIDNTRFDREAAEVADDLKKARLIREIRDDEDKVVSKIVARGLEFIPYTKKQNKEVGKGRYKFLLELDPGEVSLKNVIGTLVLNLSTKDGSCVTLEKAEINGELLKKKGKLMKALQLDALIPKDRVPGINAADKNNGQLYIEWDKKQK